MLLYKDVLSGDEMFSDAFPIKVVEQIVYEVDCTMITVKQGVDVDIGANPSAEEQEDDALVEGAVQVNNVVHSFRLETTPFDKKSYLTYLKGYMKQVKMRLEEEVKALEDTKNTEKAEMKKKDLAVFEAKAQVYAKKIIANFKDFEFVKSPFGSLRFSLIIGSQYTGSSQNPEGMVALLNYREDGITPYLTFWIHGLEEQKL
jgi:hypothetical protein